MKSLPMQQTIKSYVDDGPHTLRSEVLRPPSNPPACRSAPLSLPTLAPFDGDADTDPMPGVAFGFGGPMTPTASCVSEARRAERSPRVNPRRFVGWYDRACFFQDAVYSWPRALWNQLVGRV